MDSPSVQLSLISRWVQGSPTSPLSVFHSKSLWPLTSAVAHSDILFASPSLLWYYFVILEDLSTQKIESSNPVELLSKVFYPQLFISVSVNHVALRGASLTFCSFTYPVEGYHPLQDPPTADLIKAKRLLGYMKNVMCASIDTQV